MAQAFGFVLRKNKIELLATLVIVELSSPVTVLKGVGEEVAKKLSILGIRTLSDLIENYPRRYDDYSNVVEASRLRPGNVTILAKIKHATNRYVRRGLHITEAIAADMSGSVRLIWFGSHIAQIH